MGLRLRVGVKVGVRVGVRVRIGAMLRVGVGTPPLTSTWSSSTCPASDEAAEVLCCVLS